MQKERKVNDMPLQKEKRYTAEEFLAITSESNEHYELIDGEIINFASPSEIHQDISGEIFGELRDYIKKNKGGCKLFHAAFDVKLSDDTIVQPDILIVCDKNKLDGHKCNGAPDFVVEITSESNWTNDYHRKFTLYQKYGIREYWIVSPTDQRVVVHNFEKGKLNEIYMFSDDIPVGIYNGKITINLKELLRL